MTRNSNPFGIKPIKLEPVSLFGEEKRDKRDSRRAFTQTQKNEVWDRQNGKCANCRTQLMRSATHYDHIKPWEIGGKTIVANCQALCPTCHSRKSNKDRLVKVDKKRQTKNSVGLFNLPKGRSKNPFRL